VPVKRRAPRTGCNFSSFLFIVPNLGVSGGIPQIAA
jgi:hypothetical protein